MAKDGRMEGKIDTQVKDGRMDEGEVRGELR